MRRFALPLLAVAGTAFATAAQADPAFDGFRNFCVANRGAPAAVLAAADAAGWSPVPAAQLAQPGMQNANGRILPLPGGGAALLITATQTTPQLGAANICMIGAAPAGSSDLGGQLAAFAAVPKQSSSDLPEGLYAWRDENGRHVSVPQGTPDYNSQFTSGASMIATTRTVPQMNLIVLMTAAR